MARIYAPKNADLAQLQFSNEEVGDFMGKTWEHRGKSLLNGGF